MAVGFPTKVNYATGDVLSATNMNDLSGTVNLLESAQYAAGKNKIINGDFGVWQRGTTATLSGSTATYLADRFYTQTDGTGGTITVTQQTFTPGTAPVSGYEGQYFHRVACTVARTGTTYGGVYQKIEDVRTLAGQTVTLSFWAKADSARTVTGNLEQNFGSGGSTSVFSAGFSISATTAWTRFSYTVALASIAGKTIGTSSYLNAYVDLPKNTTYTIDIWGVQLEAASSASVFQTATGTKQAELAACQRYYYRFGSGTGAQVFGSAYVYSSTVCIATIKLAQTMRTTPVLDTTGTAANYRVLIGATSIVSNSVPTLDSAGFGDVVSVTFTSASTSTVGYAGYALTNGNNVYLGFSAEL
jgi:hypothetical protein